MSVSATTPDTSPITDRSAWYPTLGTLAVGLLAMAVLFWGECAAAVRVWMDSTAYGHCFLVLPIVAYLIWDRRHALAGLLPQPNVLLAVLALPLPFAWLLAEQLGIMEGRQLVALTAVQVLLLSVLGWRLWWALSGPLLYLYFLVPFGAFVTPALQNFTAGFIDVGLDVLGVPHIMTDLTVEISAGAFFVAEACAGLRFLIASIAFGVFFALGQRLQQARNSVFGAAQQPMLMSVGLVPAPLSGPGELDRLLAELQRIVAAQAELVARLTPVAR